MSDDMIVDDNSTPATPTQQNISIDSTGLAEAIAEGFAKRERKKVSYGEYIARGGTSPFHPNTDKYPDGPSHPKLRHTVYQNGGLVSQDTLHDVEIELLNTITHSGRYCDRLVEVIVSNEGQVDETVDIRFSNRSVDDRFNVQAASGYSAKRHKSVFHALLDQISKDQADERVEMAEDNAKTSSRSEELSPGNGVPDRRSYVPMHLRNRK